MTSRRRQKKGEKPWGGSGCNFTKDVREVRAGPSVKVTLEQDLMEVRAETCKYLRKSIPGRGSSQN